MCKLVAVMCAIGVFLAVAGNANAAPLTCAGQFPSWNKEACVAYVANDAHWALEQYYKFANSDGYFKDRRLRFATRYGWFARQQIVNRPKTPINLWGPKVNTVTGPEINILPGSKSNQACGKAVLFTAEKWLVQQTSAAGANVLYQENFLVHTIVLRRDPEQKFVLNGVSMRVWIVTSNYVGKKKINSTC